MSIERAQRIPTNDRSMDTPREGGSETFFFPKRNPPISVRAASREQAEKQLEEVPEPSELPSPNPMQHD